MCLKNILLFTLAICSIVTLIDSPGPNNGEAERVDHGDVRVQEQFQCANGKSIPAESRCNGEVDCTDQSDEHNCSSCKENAFRCRDAECISDSQVCDLIDDCEDGSDEDNCTNRTCGIDEFRCKSGQCSAKSVRCNGLHECFDNSDEENCLECHESEMSQPFKCHSNNLCISREQICNTNKDCPDGSDEDHTTCQNLQCTKDEFQCAAGHCISKQGRCNGYDSCGDNSGDTNCTQCGLFGFKCKTENLCIKKDLLCDLQPNCEDGSDESKFTC